MTTESKLLGASGTTHLTRPRYSAGLTLQDSDLTQAVDYTRELNRLMFRSLLGCGVVCGLEVTLHLQNKCLSIQIAPGLALDGCGDPIHVATKQVIDLDSDCNFQKNAKTLWVLIRRADSFCMPRDLACSSDEDVHNTTHTRVRDGFVILLEEREKARDGACGTPKPETSPPPDPAKTEWYLNYADGKCECNCASEWVVLALVEDIDKAEEGWRYGNHRVRRFLRPALMPDPVPGKLQTTFKPDANPPTALEKAREKARAQWLAADTEKDLADGRVADLSRQVADPANTANLPALNKKLADAQATAGQLKTRADQLGAEFLAANKQLK